WSGRRDLNPRLRPWQGRTLPLSYSRSCSHSTALAHFVPIHRTRKNRQTTPAFLSLLFDIAGTNPVWQERLDDLRLDIPASVVNVGGSSVPPVTREASLHNDSVVPVFVEEHRSPVS